MTQMETNKQSLKTWISIKHVILITLAIHTNVLVAQTDEITDLAEFEVSGYRQGSLFHRGGAGASDLLGLDPMEFERSVAYWDSEAMAARGLQDVEGMLEKIPGGYAPARFGVVTVPNIRGDAADTFFNGQRRGDNLFGMRPSFQSVESIEILMGPGTVSEGPGKRTGGLVNFLSKRARPGLNFGEVKLSLGTWVPSGGSYNSVGVNFDYNYSLGKGKALRVNLSLLDDKTYYEKNGGENDAVEMYLTYHYENGTGLQWDLLAVYNWQSAPQVLGVNRPWQGLIDDGLYITGGVDNSIGQSVPPGFFDPGIADPGLITSGPEALVKIARDRVLMSEGDTGEGRSFLTQSLLSKKISGDARIAQQVLLEFVDRSKLNQFYYAEDVQQVTLDAQLQWEWKSDIGSLQSSTELGLQGRWEDRENYSNYWNEFSYAFDITTVRRFNSLETFPGNIAFGAVAGPNGQPWYLPGSVFATPESTKSQLGQLGFYWKQSLETKTGWVLSGGLRVDGYAFSAKEVIDPVVRERMEDSESLFTVSGHFSLEKRFENALVYLTYGNFSGVAGNTVGDGINLHAPGMVREDDFENSTELLELGVKWHFGDWLSVAVNGYKQERTRPEFFGNNNIDVEGGELQIEYVGEKNWGASLGLGVMNAHYKNSTPAEFGGGSLNNTYAVGAGPTGEGNGLGYIRGFFVNSLVPGDYRIPGISDYIVRPGIWYAPIEALRLSLWGTWQSEQKGNMAGEYFIPGQSTLNASVTIKWDDWEILISGMNITNEDNWLHNGDTYFDQLLVSRSASFHAFNPILSVSRRTPSISIRTAFMRTSFIHE